MAIATVTATASTTYVFDNAWRQARRRLATLEAIADPGTIRRLEALGVGAGWRCLEVGAGGGSIAEWLCRRVGFSGRVVATDLDPRFLDPLADDHPNLEVWRHDVVGDDLPAGAFDLVHTRLVLGHLPERDHVLTRLIAALKPGGWLVVEELDLASVAPDPGGDPEAAAIFERPFAAHLHVWQAHDGDPFLGRRLPRLLRAGGLVEADADGRSFVWRGGTPDVGILRLTFEQLRPAMVASGRVSTEEVDGAIALLDDPDFAFLSPVIVAAWGRRPEA